MSTGNNRLCQLITLHGRRDEGVFGKTQKATKRLPNKVKVFNPTHEGRKPSKEYLEQVKKATEAAATLTEQRRKERIARKKIGVKL